MQLPLHPFIVHFPIVLTFILPFLIVAFAFMIKANKISTSGWLIIIGLQLSVTVLGYVSLETGEIEEEVVQKVVAKELIHRHEEAAEIFVGVTVICLALSIATYFLRKDLQFYLQLSIAGITVLGAFLAYRAGTLGGELVYKHGAAAAYSESGNSPEGILPTPGMNTSESEFPVEEE